MKAFHLLQSRTAVTLVMLVGFANIGHGAAPTASESADGWRGVAARDEIKPAFSFNPKGGPLRRGALLIQASDREGLDGHWEKTFDVKGGQYYRFHALRRVKNVPVPRHSVLVRIHWRDAQGRPVHHDAPGAHSYAPDKPPVAEPEYPNDGQTDKGGWTELGGIYRAPSKAAKAIVELHLRWAPRATVEWSEVSLSETAPPSPRKVRLAAVHYMPRGGKTAMDNCQQFEPMIADAARQKADLIVLPETLTVVGNGVS